MSDNLYDLEAVAANLANWSDRIQSNIDILNADTQRRMAVVLGENVAAYAPLYIYGVDGKAYKAKAATGMLPAIGLANEAGSTSDAIRVVTFGVVTNAGWAFTPQRLIIVSSATAGVLVDVTSLNVGPKEFVQVIGVSLTATKIFVAPSLPFQIDFKPGAYTAAGKPVAGNFTGQLIFITDAGATGRLAYWAVDAAWRYVKDDSAV